MLAEGFSNRFANPAGRVRTSSPEPGGTDPEEAWGLRETRGLDTRFVDDPDLLVVLRVVVRRADPPATAFLRLVFFLAVFFAAFFFAALFFAPLLAAAFLAAFFLAVFFLAAFFAAFFAAVFVPFRAAFPALFPARFPALLRAAGFRAVFLRADMMQWTSPSMGRLERAAGA